MAPILAQDQDGTPLSIKSKCVLLTPEMAFDGANSLGSLRLTRKMIKLLAQSASAIFSNTPFDAAAVANNTGVDDGAEGSGALENLWGANVEKVMGLCGEVRRHCDVF
jgi:hypothetical protein